MQGLQLLASLHRAPAGPHAPGTGTYPQAGQNSLRNSLPAQISITLSTQIGSSWPGWHPPTFSLDRCHVRCNAMAGAVLLHLRRKERNPLSLRKKEGKRKCVPSGGRRREGFVAQKSPGDPGCFSPIPTLHRASWFNLTKLPPCLSSICKTGC